MDTDLKRAADDGRTGTVRRESAEEACPESEEEDGKTGMERLTQCPDHYSFEIGM